MQRKKYRMGGLGNTSSWAGSLKKIPCFIIGNGPFLNKVDLKILEDYFTIGINRAFLKIDPTILIWQDLALWLQHKKQIKKLKAIRYCRRASATGADKICYYFNMTGRDSRLSGDPGMLYGRGSSGPLGFQLAFALGCNPIILVGMDCKYDKKGNTDFYGKNPMHRPHTLVSCKAGLKWIKKFERKRKILNCSKNKIFEERLSIEEVIEIIGKDKALGREKFTKKILKNKV